MKNKKAIKTYNAIVTALKQYFTDLGFTKCVIGLSGGIDSAVTACVAVEALGKENVIFAFLPSKFTSNESKQYVTELILNLNIEYCGEFDITSVCELILGGPLVYDKTIENVQSRIRMVYLMALANDNNALLLSTGNQTEDELGYYTLYGDGAGAIAPLGLLDKMEVYDIARIINKDQEIIPQGIIDRQPHS